MQENILVNFIVKTAVLYLLEIINDKIVANY